MNSIEPYIILGHENPDVDSVVSGYLLERLMLSLGYNAEFRIPDKIVDEETMAICKKFGLDIEKYNYLKPLPESRYRYILVDHHQRKLNGYIFAVIDHHPSDIGLKILYYQNELASSTSCLICRKHEEYFNKNDIRLAILAAMVDTASFHSTKTRTSDIKWAHEMCKKYDIDYSELYQAGLCLTDLSNLNAAKLNGLKKYQFNNHLVESSYIQIEDITSISSELSYIIDNLMTYVQENNLSVFVFIVHDMTRFKTTVYDITSNNYTVRYYDKYTSRGNKIIPETESLILEEDINNKISLALKVKKNHTNLN